MRGVGGASHADTMLANAFGQFGEIDLGYVTHAAFFRLLNERVEKRFVIYAARDGIQQESGRGSVRDAMIKGKTQDASVAHSELRGAHDGALRDSSDAKNGSLRAIENRGESVNAVNAEIADGRGCSIEVRRLQAAGESAVG